LAARHHGIGLSALRRLKLWKAADGSADEHENGEEVESRLSHASHLGSVIMAVSAYEVVDMISYISMFKSCPIRRTADFR
jgi:hypothetical protein